MTFTEIIQDSLTDLPLVRRKESDFREFLFNKLNRFNDLIQSSDNLSGNINGIEFDSIIFKRRNSILIEGLIKTINGYYEGNPHKAYTILSKSLKESAITGYLQKDFYIPKDSDFYRIRTKDSNYPISKKEIFHIPFNMRERVATQRFSIPGLPSLYIANSIFVAWEELGRPSDNLIQASRFCNDKELKVLDLTNDIYLNGHLIEGNEAHGWQLLYYVMVWPLIAACSVKVPDSNVAFKPEYIIPQLLLQWINKNELVGIKYSSTHINMRKNKHVGQMYNIVIPVRTFNVSSGFCKELVDMFKVSNVLPMQLNQFGTNKLKINEKVNKELDMIELVEGRRIDYSKSAFGQIEGHLKNIDVCKITNG